MGVREASLFLAKKLVLIIPVTLISVMTLRYIGSRPDQHILDINLGGATGHTVYPRPVASDDATDLRYTVDDIGSNVMVEEGVEGVPSLDEFSAKDEFISLTRHQSSYPVGDLPFYVHRAFQDDRYNQTYFRVFGLEKVNSTAKHWFCRWSTKSGSSMVTHEVQARKYLIYSKWPSRHCIYYANMFDCHLPSKLAPGEHPDTMELVSYDRKHSVTVPVEQTIVLTPRRQLAVCVKPLTSRPSVERMVEWVEMMRAAGVEHFILYLGDIHGGTRFVLEYYEKLGIMTVVTFPFLLSVLSKIEPPTLPSKERYTVYEQTHLVAMNDCLYRFQGSYEHLMFIDIDEVMLPTDPSRSWGEVLEDLTQRHPQAAGFLFPTAWHHEESGPLEDSTIPHHLYMQRYARSTPPHMSQPKSVVVPKRVISINYHTVIDVPSKDFTNERPNWKTSGYVHHFRGKCTTKFSEKECKEHRLVNIDLDPVIPTYRSKVEKRTKQVLEHLQL